MAGSQCVAHLKAMLKEDKITRNDFDVLTASLNNDLKKCAQQVSNGDGSITFNVPGLVDVSRTLSYPELESITKVFNTPELLEMILLFLPIEDLLIGVERTCEAFRHAMDNSTKIQRHLFCVAMSTSALQAFPLILEVSEVYPEYNQYAQTYAGVEDLLLFFWPFDMPQSMRKSRSLRKTFITQPPVKHLTPLIALVDGAIRETSSELINLDGTHECGSYVKFSFIHNDDGITFSDLFDYIGGLEDQLASEENRLRVDRQFYEFLPCDGPK